MNLFETQKSFYQEIIDLIKQKQLTEIYVNVYLGSALSDAFTYFNYEKENINQNIYKIGTFINTNVFINSNLKYSDLKIYGKEGEIYEDFTEKYKKLNLV